MPPPPFMLSPPQLLNFYKFPGDAIPIVRGSALAALNGTDDTIGKNAILKVGRRG